MKKGTIILITLLFMVIGYSAYNTTVNLYGNSKIAENISDFKVYISSLKVNGNEVSGINETKDGFSLSNIDGNIEVEITNDSTEYDTEASLECSTNNTWDFDYTGSEQTLTIPITGTYKLETWGAQGGIRLEYKSYNYGGYSLGELNLEKNNKIYVNVGGQADNFSNSKISNGGYNGGGYGGITTSSTASQQGGAGGGGATHIATKSGLLSSLVNYKSSILIVSGGGGGDVYPLVSANSSGGGYIGSNGGYHASYPDFHGIGGTQSNGGYDYQTKSNYGSFGKGSNLNETGYGGNGGGGGYFGGGGTNRSHSAAGGGSGYIGNQLLTNKAMYCHNCSESNEISTKTISTTCVSSTPKENCAKQGNGYARITLLKSNNQIKTEKITIEALDVSTKTIENVEAVNLTCKLKLNKISRSEKKIYNGPTVWNYDYTGGEQTFIAPVTGTYKLETWGAQGGYVKGIINSDEAYGGYSVGNVILNKDINLYIQVGGMGLSYDDNKSEISTGNGYNGGGISSYQISSVNNYYYGSGGGGATHVATVSGLLESLNNNIDKIIMVSGGGGGSSTSSLKVNNNTTDGIGGSGGGYIGINGSMLLTYPSELVKKFNDDRWYGTGGNQVSGGGSQSTHSLSQLIAASFGKGCTPTNSFFSSYMKVSGGGGFYGGGCGTHSGGGGGSGYIGNSLLTEKSMYCYNCTESSEESTKTISTTCANENPTENCAKQGNGYARITLIS